MITAAKLEKLLQKEKQLARLQARMDLRKKFRRYARRTLISIGEGLKSAGRYASKTMRRLLEAIRRFCASSGDGRIKEYLIEQLKRNGFIIDPAAQTPGRQTARGSAAARGQTGRRTYNASARKKSRPRGRETLSAARSSHSVHGRSTASVRSVRARSETQRSVRAPAVRKRSRHRRFAERHLRSLTALGLLVCALIAFVSWGNLSANGMRTFASLGIGKAQGYVLLGDDCMRGGNYSRAVEHYYEALRRGKSYDAAYRLASAYSYTGDVSREVSALLWCVEYYPEQKPPYTQLLLLYPEESERPSAVKEAIAKGYKLFGSLK